MVEICPNKSSKEWKDLVETSGSEYEATKIWKAWNLGKAPEDYVIPTVDQVTGEGLLPEKKDRPRFQYVIDDLTRQQRILGNSLSKKKSDLKGSTGEKRLSLQQDILRLEKRIEDIDSKISELGKLNEIEGIYNFANEDLEEVRKTLSSDTVSVNDLENVKQILKLWTSAGDLTDRNIFLTEEELKGISDPDNEVMQTVADKLKQIEGRAERLEAQWMVLAKSLFEKKFKEDYGSNAKIDWSNILKDINALHSLLLDIGETDNTIAQAMFDWNKKVMYESKLEAKELTDKLGESFKELHKTYSAADIDDMFSQTVSNKDTRRTGNMVHQFSNEFFQWQKDRWNKYRRSLRNAKDIEDSKVRNKTISDIVKEFKKDEVLNTTIFDVRKLFPNKEFSDKTYTKQEVEAHRQELIKHLGQKKFDYYLGIVEKRLQDFTEDRKAEETLLKNEWGDDVASYSRELEEWDYRFNPYRYADYFFDNTIFKVAGEVISSNTKYVQQIPKRTVNGKETGFYDTKFDRIESDPKLSAVYEFIQGTMQELHGYLPEEMKQEFSSNTIPFIEKQLLEQFTENGVQGGLNCIWDAWKQNIRSSTGRTIEGSEERDVTGEKERQLRVNYLIDNSKVIKDYLDRKAIEWMQEKGIPDIDKMSKESREDLRSMKKEWTKDIKDKLARERTVDLEKVLKAYTLSVIAFKHKAKIIDALNAGYDILNNAIEQQVNNAGEPIKDNFGRPITKKGLEHLRSALDNFMDRVYGEKTMLEEMKGKKKLYTKEEQLTKKDLEDKLKQNESDLSAGTVTRKEFTRRERILQKQLDQLGGVFTGSKFIDQINMYIRIKGLGWNFFSPIMNMNVGFFGNITEASAGVRFNQEQLLRAYTIVFSGMTKTSNLMAKLDVLKQIQNEIYKTEQTKKKYNWLAPFYLQERSEYMNQAPVMVAMMLNTKVKLGNKEISLWDAYDEQGNLKEGVEFDETAFKVKVDDAVKDIHGNYDADAQIPANKFILGRSLLIFRKWMIQAFYTRLGGYKQSRVGGIDKKGRWRSYAAYFGEYGAVGGAFDMMKQLLRKLSFQKTTFNENMDELDAANMRRNMTEIMSVLAVSALALLVKGAMQDDDEEKDSNFKFLAFFYINQLNRVERDLMFYVDPQQFKAILRDPLPLMGVVEDASTLVKNSMNLITGGEDEYQSGPRKGQSKTWVSAKEIVPALNMTNRVETMFTQIYQNK